jgi:hypothetical protein
MMIEGNSINWTTKPSQVSSYPLLRLYSTESTECWPDTTSNLRAYPMKLSSLLRPVKDHLGLGTSGVYRIPCDCSRVYTGHTGRSVDLRLKEHQRHIRLEHLDKSAIAEHSIDHGHCIQFHNSSILATKTRYMDCIVREAIKIKLHPYNIRREGCFCLSKSWKPLIGSLKIFMTGPRPTWLRCPHTILNPCPLYCNPRPLPPGLRNLPL